MRTCVTMIDEMKCKAMKKSDDQGKRSLRQVSYFSDDRDTFQRKFSDVCYFTAVKPTKG